MTPWAWLATGCAGWLLLSAVLMLVALRRAPERDDWD